MRSFGRPLALLVVVTGVARAQQSAATLAIARSAGSAPVAAVTAAATVSSPAIPRRFVQRVALDIARQWGDDTAALQLTWGRVPGTATFPTQTDVRLVGRGDGGWFVAVFDPGAGGLFAVRLRAGARDSTLIASRTVEPGRVLSADDVRTVPHTRWGPPLQASGFHVGAGWVTRHMLMAGAEVTESSVVPPPLVHAGDPIRLEWRRGTVLITLDGTALDAGGAGQTVRVRVGQNRGAKNGTVLATGIVRLDS
jgi:flagellar basal body P-ring formation protein FlgA